MLDVAIIGAGAAGIAAARRCGELGLTCLVLEAGARPGGRAFTESDSLGAPFDHGASWVHVAEHNPMTPLAAALGFTRFDGPRRQREILLIGDRRATAEERRAHDAACDAWEAAAEARAAEPGPDIPIAAAVPRDGHGGSPWAATASHWLGSIICGVEPERNSLRDYIDTGLDGENPQLAEGFGTLVARLAEGLPIRLASPVRRIRAGRIITVETAGGAIEARAAIVTVSTGVLAAGTIAFEPGLPPAVEAAIAGLPMALLSKIALRGGGPGSPLGLPPFARLGRQVQGPADRPMSWMIAPFGRDQAIGFIGGEAAWDLSRRGPAAAEAAARADLARFFGAETVARAFPEPAVVTDWGENPLFLGAYTYARVGQAGARRLLAEAALADGRLRFAGEACHARYAGTVGGAWASGIAAAEATAATLAGSVAA
ncbi:NAD(P)/FAD-dependent oxidoreductase [Paeniroseomonas aquatica]|uniref:Tryptophan 2-monooxygenase n=2 Tax=Paeniroseomonas aquatica TaxID=373043 RepID=A0ABT8A0S0_9PROT|nr:NAD(P)/FAD-dependent oxidoreductase [Paeniroseomonas aquatica]MDN3563333.1 NAD(P)/FAD-dependent oxidoreductase [Paeniroseomonas aquatica]